MLSVEIWEINARNIGDDKTAFDIAFDESEAILKQEQFYDRGFDIAEIKYVSEQGLEKEEELYLIGKRWTA